MASYKSLQVAAALDRVSASLAPKVSTTNIANTAYANNYIAPDPTLAAQQLVNTPMQQETYRSLGEYAQDAGVALGKGIVGVPQAGAGIVDLLDTGLQSTQQLSQQALAAIGLAPEVNWEVQGGRFTKALDDAGVRFADAKNIIGQQASAAGLQQAQELAAIPGMSTQKSLGDNLSSLGQTLGYALDNPSLVANTIVESVPSLLAGGAIGRGAGALGARGMAGAIGEGTVMAGQAQANMDRNAQGYTTAEQALGALGIGVLGGGVGLAGQRVANRFGGSDIDQVASGMGRTPSKGMTSLAVGTATEAAEEAAQSSLENVISNISSGKDAIQGLNQDLVLGTLAGAGMGAGINAKSSLADAALSAITNAAVRQQERIRERMVENAPELSDTDTADLANPTSPDYNPTAAIIREAKAVTPQSSPEEIAAVRERVDTVMMDAETHLSGLESARDTLKGIDVLRNNIANGEAAIARFAETDPAKAEQITSIVDGLKEQYASVEQYVGKEKALDDAITHATTLVDEARTMHEKYSGILGGTPSSQTTEQKIFGAPTSYTPEQINAAINDPQISEASKVALRALSEAVAAQNAVKDIDAVNQQVVGKKFDANYRSTPQYLEQYSRAVKTGNAVQQSNLLREIGAFQQSHVQKAEVVAQGLQLAMSGQPTQVVRTEAGTWEINTGDWLSRSAARENGAITIRSPKQIEAVTKMNEYMQAEAQAITATQNAMLEMSKLQEPTSQPSVAPTAPMSFDDAMDSFNQEARDNYDFQSARRVEDPRNTQTRPGTTTATPGTGTTQAEVQPAQEGTPTTTNTEQRSVEGEVAQAERVASRSVSEDVATEVQTSTDKAITANQDVSTDTQPNETVVQETKQEAEPQDINSAETADKNAARTAERAKAPNKRNLVVDGFNKKDTILNKTANFITTTLNRSDNKTAVSEITGLYITDTQSKTVNDFVKFSNFMSSKLDGLIRERKGTTAKGNDYADFRYQDFNQFLLEDGQLPENTKTAISAAMFTWLGENGSKTLNTEREVASLLLVSNVEDIPQDIYSKFRTVGEHQSAVAASIGQKAVAALGLKTVSDVDPARKAKLEMAVGTLALVALNQNGYIERTEMPRAEFDAARDDLMATNEDSVNEDSAVADKSTISFIRPKTDDGVQPNKRVEQIIKSSKGSSGIVSKLFDMPSYNKLPSTEPVTSTPNTFNRMGSAIPSFAKDVYEKSQKNGYKMSATAMQFMDKVSRDDLKTLFGYVKQNEDGSFDGMHKRFWEGQEAANQALERSLDLIAEQRANLGDDSKEFFFEHTIWTNQRSGYDAAFNLQANKVHRAVAGMSAHITEVGVGEPTHNADGTTTKYGEFLQAVAMSAEGASDVLGIQTVDKMSSASFLPKFQEYLQRDYVQAGIESMASIIETKSTKEDIANIERVVKEFGMGPMSVRALQALAQHYIAERDGARTFTTDIAFESDGVTNGPVITNVALGTADADMLEAGGVFTNKAKTNVPTNKEQGKEDIYEQLGGVMQQMWAEYKADPNIKPKALASANALGVIYPAFGKRKGAKPITTTSNYGAGNASIIRANGREVLNAFYTGLEKAGKTNDMAAAQNLVDAVNAVIDYHNSFLGSVPRVVPQGNIMEFMLTAEQEKALLDVSAIQHGKAIKNTLETAMKDFQEVRDTLTAQAVAGFKVYELIRKAALEEAMKDTTDVITDAKGNRQEGLSSQQEKKVLKSIARYTPSVVSGMGNNSTNSKQSSIPLMKLDTAWDGTKMSEQQFNFVGTWDSKQGKGFSVRAYAKRDVVKDPGVSGLALIIQSIDAFIAHSALGAMPVQNYHDANASQVGQGKEMAKIQNEAFVDGLMTTHVNREFVRALMNPLQKLIDDKTFYKANKQAIDTAVEELGILPGMVKRAYERDLAKLDNMKSWVNVNQYGTEGGHFVMTNAKRKQIVDAVDKLRKDYKKDMAQANAIYEVLSSKPEPTTIQDYLDQDGTMKGSDLVPMLQAELKQFHNSEGNKGKFSQFYDAMLDLITERMPEGLEVNYFSDLDAPENANGVKEAMDNNNPAWFTTGKDGNPQINILRSDSPIRAQMLVHELVHAITVDSIAQVRKDPKTHAKAKESLDKIDALYEHIKSQVEADPNASDVIKYGVKNVEEFIATGFSYPEFVDYLDRTMAPKAARGKDRIITALRSFVENILGVLESFTGRKYSAKDATALEALIIDTTELLGRTDANTTPTATIFGAPQQARDTVDTYSSQQVFEALNSNLDPAFKARLSELMRTVSDTIYRGLDDTFLTKDGNWSPEQAWDDYINQGNAMTTETAVTAGFRMTDQESFAVESLYTALVAGMRDKTMTQVYAEMDKAYRSAKAKLKPESFHEGDWATADIDDKQAAQDMYDFLFKLGRDNPEPLARFTAMALGSQQLNSLLGFAVSGVDTKPDTNYERIVEAVNKVLDFVFGLMTNSRKGQAVNSKLELLSKELARIDAKNREFAVSKLEAQMEKLTDYTDGVSQKVRDRLVSLAEKDALAKSRFTAVRLASNVTRLSAKGDLWTTLDVVKEMATMDNPNQKLGLFGEIINEAANNDGTKNAVERMLRITKLNNQTKENLRDTTSKNVMSTFEENGQYLTKDDKTAITTMLRADLGALTDQYSTKEIAKLYADKSFNNKEIASIESVLNDQVIANRAKQLAKYMITGKASPGLAKNARLVVSGFNNELVPENDPRIALADKLASLYAINYTDNATKNLLIRVFNRELKNKTNGIDTSIKFHKELAKVAKDTLFADNSVSVTKGYMPEITNPNRDIRIAGSDAEAQILKQQYYKEVRVLGKDLTDPRTNTNRLFMTEEANIQRLVSGAIEVVSTNRKGTQVFMEGKELAATINKVSRAVPTDKNYNPMSDKNVYMVPNYDTQGKVIGFSYEMSGKNRDTLLERNNDFAELLGAYAATNFNKVTVPHQNNDVVDAAYEDYKANFASNPRAYVTVGPNSTDYGLREIWALLPEDTRQHITSVWGKDGMLVRNDVLLTMFGYRKYSLNQAFDKMDEAKSMFEKIYTGTMVELFGNNAKLKGVRFERAWQEGVSLMKDIIVIRNVKTMLANTMSNAMLLMAHGVSPTDIVKDSMLAIRSGLAYRKSMARLMAIRQNQRAGVGDFNKLEQEALALEHSISRNPLAGFIEEGMMPTIVEDVDPSTDHYSYKSRLQEKVDNLTSGVPKSVKTAAKWAFVSPDTPLYKFLNNATQFSDFSSKYVMYKYYTQKAKEKLSHEDAIQIASDNFVNYDVPTARGLQYLNDMGIVMFTKYNIRIQKALFQLLKKRPATAMAQAVFINSFTNLEAGIDPLIWFNMGNPMRGGALGLPSALDEPLPIKMMTGMF